MQEKDELDEFDCSIFPVSQLRDWTQREVLKKLQKKNFDYA